MASVGTAARAEQCGSRVRGEGVPVVDKHDRRGSVVTHVPTHVPTHAPPHAPTHVPLHSAAHITLRNATQNRSSSSVHSFSTRNPPSVTSRSSRSRSYL